jgi:hypothetical protein
MTSLFDSYKRGPAMTMTLECRTEFPRALKDIMRSLELNGDVVYKGYPYMRAGQEVWQVEAHLYKNKGDDPRAKGHHMFFATKHYPSFFDSVKSAAWSVIEVMGAVLAMRLRTTEDRLKVKEDEAYALKAKLAIKDYQTGNPKDMEKIDALSATVCKLRTDLVNMACELSD